MERLGLIAGNGQFPLVVARTAKGKGYSVAACAIRGETDPSLEKEVDALTWVEFWELEKLLDFFKSQGVHKALMAGQVKKERLFKESPIRVQLPSRVADRALLGIVVKSLKGIGVELAIAGVAIGKKYSNWFSLNNCWGHKEGSIADDLFKKGGN